MELPHLYLCVWLCMFPTTNMTTHTHTPTKAKPGKTRLSVAIKSFIYSKIPDKILHNNGSIFYLPLFLPHSLCLSNTNCKLKHEKKTQQELLTFYDISGYWWYIAVGYNKEWRNLLFPSFYCIHQTFYRRSYNFHTATADDGFYFVRHFDR